MPPLRATLSRYEQAKKQTELRKLAVENRALLGVVAQSRRPDRVAARAAAMGIDLHLIESEAIAGTSPSEKKTPLRKTGDRTRAASSSRERSTACSG